MKDQIEYKIYAFDLSKSNTGGSIAYLDKDFNKIEIETYSIEPKYRPYYGAAHANDCQFIEVQQILAKIKEVLIKDSVKKFIVLENPVYQSFSSELAYYMQQSVLSIACELGIDAIGIPPTTLKKFIAFQYREFFQKDPPKKKKTLDKTEIKFIYKALKTTQYFEKYKIKNDPNNDDEMDAFFLIDYIISSFNENYMSIWNSKKVDPDQYRNLSYVPMYANPFNLLYNIQDDFFTLSDRKFYVTRYIKHINFIN